MQSTAVHLPSGPKIWLQDNRPLTVEQFSTHANRTEAASHANLGTAVSLSKSQPVSMVSGDVDQDGYEDLLVGYSSGPGGYISIQRGNIDAFAPQSDESFQAIARGDFPSPFLTKAATFAVPVSPDFIALGDFLGKGNQDLVVAARGVNPIGTGTLSGGVATLTASNLAVGNHTITASFPESLNFDNSIGALTGNPQVVNKANATSAVTSSVNPSVFGQSVWLRGWRTPSRQPTAGTSTSAAAVSPAASLSPYRRLTSPWPSLARPARPSCRAVPSPTRFW